MANNIQESLEQLLTVEGALGAALVDSHSGMLVAKVGGGVDLELAAAGNTEVVKAKLKTMQNLRLDDYIEDILITLGKQYHIIRPLAKAPDLFLYCVLDKSQAILALARRKMQDVESTIRLE